MRKVQSGDAAACHWSIRQATVRHHAERIELLKRITPFDIFPDQNSLNSLIRDQKEIHL